MDKFDFLALLRQYLKDVHSEIMNSTIKNLFLSKIKQDYKTIFPDIYDSMEAEMHKIDSRLMLSFLVLIKGLLYELQDHLDSKQYEDLKEVLDLWNVPKKYV